MRGALPLWMGVIPFGFIYGPLARSAGLDPLSAQATSVIIFGSSAQFILAPLLDGGSLHLTGNARLAAGLAAIAVAWFSRNVVLTIVAGMLVLVALQALGGY